jgi:pseudouridine-5'-monophosphatase
MINAILFDLDGLMADSEPLAEWAWNQVLGQFGCRLDDQTLQDILGMRVIDSSALLCERFELPHSAEEAAAERNRAFLDAVPNRLKACAGLYPLLDDLADLGIPLAVATSGERKYVALALETLNIAGRFHIVVTGDEVTNGKPAPDIYILAAERLGVDPADCIVLEDAPLGVAAARAAGMMCIAVPNPRIPVSEFGEANWVFASLEDVREPLKAMIGEQISK